MIDQNPKFICSVFSSPKNMLDIGDESWVIKFKLHRLMALNEKRLLNLKNTSKDEVLTKNLGVMIKHCDQYHFIFEID